MVLYTIVPYVPQDCRERALQAAILTGSSFNNLKGGGGGRFGEPEARPLGTFESNHKVAASEGEHSISRILRKNRGL